MLSYQEQCHLNFESLVAPWEEAYRVADIAYVALITADGPRLLLGRIFLVAFNEAQGVSSFRMETDHLIAGRILIDISSIGIKPFLDKARSGEMLLALDGTSIPVKPDSSLSVSFSPIRHPFASEGVRLPNIRISGIDKHRLMTEIDGYLDIDWELKSAKQPFNDLDELLNQCGLPIQRDMGTQTWFEIVATSPAIISDSSIVKDGEVRIECHVAASLETKKFRLGYKVFNAGAVVRRESMEGDAIQWKQENNINVGTYRLNVGDASLIQGYASYANVGQHQWWITDPNKRLNPRHAIHQIFDDDLELLRKLLFKVETDKSHIFEHAVSMLFNLLGFSVSNYGRIPKLQKGPDIIIASPIGHIGVVECTIGLLDENDKIAKLVQRTTLIRDKLNRAGYGHLQIQPVVVTPLSRNEIEANLDVASKHGIAVICKEDIEGMITQISLPLNPDKLFEDAKRLVPNMMNGLFAPR